MKKALTSILAPTLALAACLFAAGCTDSDWNHLLNYGGLGEDEAAPARPAATAAAESAAAAAPAAEPGNTDFCRNVATEDATQNGFDKPTQQRVFQRSFQQCMAVYSH